MGNVPTESDAKTDTKPDCDGKPDTIQTAVKNRTQNRTRFPYKKPDNKTGQRNQTTRTGHKTRHDNFRQVFPVRNYCLVGFADPDFFRRIFSMSLLAGRTFGGSGLAYVLFSVVGLIIGYSAISTTRAAYHAPRRADGRRSWAPFWIVVICCFPDSATRQRV
jgi:hypothetical protein